MSSAGHPARTGAESKLMSNCQRDFRHRVPLVFRPNFELSEPLNCTELENVKDDATVFNTFMYVACAGIVILHIRHHSSVGSTLLFGLVASSVGLVLTPFLLLLGGIFTVYRFFVKKQLEKELGFVGVMDGSDAYWAGEQVYARSIINILCMVDFSKVSQIGRSPIDVMRGVMRKIVDGEATPKLKCKKKLSTYGYYYLQKCDIDLEKNVRHIEPPIKNKADLECFVSEVANEPLIEETFWEVLVGREALDGSFPIIFRVHHALGDGYALVQLFLDFMADKERISRKFVRKESVLQRLVSGDYNLPALHIMTSWINKVFVYIYACVVFAEQLLTPPDRNSLHNRIYLSGKKVCRWSGMDLQKVKEIRRALNCRFTDVILTVLSNSLENCFGKWGEEVEQIKIVVPARLSGTGSGISNLFSVAMFDLPVTGKEKLETIQRVGERLRKLPDFYVNYWLLRVGFTIFPATFMAKLVVSTQSTIAISNVPGPQVTTKLAGCDVTDLVFLLPNRDTTGVGISMLSYGNKFNVGISIDSSLLTSDAQVEQILSGFSRSIEQMHSACVARTRQVAT